MLSAAEFERRVPVWKAYSDLFLDTELQPEDHRRIIVALRESGYPPDTLRHVLFEEVAPAFGTNLLSVAGEWVPWSEEEVRTIMTRSLAMRWYNPRRWIARLAATGYARRKWTAIAPMLGSVPRG